MCCTPTPRGAVPACARCCQPSSKLRQSCCLLLSMASQILGPLRVFLGLPHSGEEREPYPLASLARPHPARHRCETAPVGTTRAVLGEQLRQGLSLTQALAVHLPCQLYIRERFIFWSKKKKKRASYLRCCSPAIAPPLGLLPKSTHFP